MLTRDKSSSEDLLFEKDIEKPLRLEWRKIKHNQGDQEKLSDPTSPKSQCHTTQTKSMVENRNNEEGGIFNAPRRILLDYVMQQRSRYFSSIIMFVTTRSLEWSQHSWA